MHKEELLGQSIFCIHGLLTSEECAGFIASSEHEGYGDAPITMGDSAIVLKDVRNNMRVMVDTPELAAQLFERARPFLPERLEAMELVGLNERFRFYRYDPGQTFTPHYDGSFRRSVSEWSELTFMVYLNDDFEGGETNFFREDGSTTIRVKPVTGMALVFTHPILHEGAVVLSGRKYVIRTDVMYRIPRPKTFHDLEPGSRRRVVDCNATGTIGEG